jgi:hypothetical protein
MRKIKFALPLLLILLCLSFAYQVNASGLLDTVKEGGLDEIGDTAYNQSGTPTDIRVTVARLINISLGFLGIIFTTLVVYAGYQWMTSGGDSAKIGEAKKRVTAGVIGLIIILASWGVSMYVTSCIWQVTSDSGTWICPGH